MAGTAARAKRKQIREVAQLQRSQHVLKNKLNPLIMFGWRHQFKLVAVAHHNTYLYAYFNAKKMSKGDSCIDYS